MPRLGRGSRGVLGKYNGALEAGLSALEAELGITIARLDAFALMNHLAEEPASFGLLNVADSCITPRVIAGAICRRPETYLFWDVIHPTTRAHRLVAEEAAAVLTATFPNLASVARTEEARVNFAEVRRQLLRQGIWLGSDPAGQ